MPMPVEAQHHYVVALAINPLPAPTTGACDRLGELIMIKIFALGLLAAATISAPAFATPPVAEARIAAVQYGDLDLSTENGQRVLDRRIAAAARDVCGTDERITGSLTPSTSSRTCYVRAINNLEREVAARTDRQQQRG